MAIFRPGALAAVISGTVGGVEFAQGRSVAVVRKRRCGVRKNTAVQKVRRARFQQVTGAWSGLAESERAAWRAAASLRTFPNRLGIERYLSGYQLFVWVQMDVVGGVSIMVAPPDFMHHLPVAEGVSLAVSAGGNIELDWTTITPPALPYSMISGVRTMSGRPCRRFREWRYLTTVLTGPGAHHQHLDTWWDAVLGHPIEGEVVAVRVAIYRPEYLKSFSVAAQAVTVA